MNTFTHSLAFTCDFLFKIVFLPTIDQWDDHFVCNIFLSVIRSSFHCLPSLLPYLDSFTPVFCRFFVLGSAFPNANPTKSTLSKFFFRLRFCLIAPVSTPFSIRLNEPIIFFFLLFLHLVLIHTPWHSVRQPHSRSRPHRFSNANPLWPNSGFLLLESKNLSFAPFFSIIFVLLYMFALFDRISFIWLYSIYHTHTHSLTPFSP